MAGTKLQLQRTGNSRTIAMIAIGVVVFLVVGLVVIAIIDLPDPQRDYTQLDAQGRLVGEADAPVLIREFADFRCSQCKDAAATLTPNIIEDYVNTGLARLEYIPVTVINDESILAGQAALCAEEQGRFWTYHEKLFERQGREQFSNENLIRWAGEVNLNEQEFRNCLTSSRYLDELNANMREFQESGAGDTLSTPTFLINDEVVVGAVPWEDLKAVIDAQLASTRGEALPVQ